MFAYLGHLWERFFICFLLFSSSIFAQIKEFNPQELVLIEDTLQNLCKHLYSTNIETDRKECNQQLISKFSELLSTENSFDFPFDSLKSYMTILVSSDSKIKIINWDIPNNDNTYEYYGFIQEKYVAFEKAGLFKKIKNESIKVYPLVDKSKEIKDPSNFVGDNTKWFGMLYYKIIVKKYKSKIYYTLLGLDNNDKLTKKKIIDVLTFDTKGAPYFGDDIFIMPKKTVKRVVFEYSASCSMTLKYNIKKDSIVFDHLAPIEPNLKGQFQYYCIDGSYDGLGFKRGKWYYGEDLNITNDKKDNDKLYNDPRSKTDKKQNVPLIPQNKTKQFKNSEK